MKIYTETGDDGTTGLFGGGRVSKGDPRLSAYGTIDELNSVLGVARAGELSQGMGEMLETLQHQMFALGAELATPNPESQGIVLLGEQVVNGLEQWIDQLEESLPPLKTFILPGGTPTAARLHQARCVCRRAEREIVKLAESVELRPFVLKYVNRVSDLLFVLARTANHEADVADIAWVKPQDK